MKIVPNQRRTDTTVAEERPVWTEQWAGQGFCRDTDPDALFVKGAAQQIAKQVCVGCPVIAECLADALDNRMEYGVWGGLTERERRALLKRRPDIESWRAVFQDARMREQRRAS